MSAVALIARLVLAVLFGTAGCAKLLDLRASSDTVEAFGVPPALARVTGRAIPLAELLVALALLIQPAARWGAVAAIVVLVVFSAGVANALSHGRTPACNCFGVVSSEAISLRTLVRNAIFAAVAAVVLAQGPGHSLENWTGNARAASLTAALAVLALAFVSVVALHFRRLAAAERPRNGLEAPAPTGPVIAIGEIAPKFELPDLDGTPVSLDDVLGRGLPVLLVLASPACGPCRALLPRLAQWNVSLSESLSFLVVESGVGSAIEALRHAVPPVEALTIVHEVAFNVALTYGARKTPTALLLSPDGRIAADPVTGDRSVEKLVRVALNSPASETAVA